MMNLTTLTERMRGWLRDDPLNRMPAEHGGFPLYDTVIAAVADVDDPLFDALRQPAVLGDHFRPPRDWLPGARSVASFFFTFTDEVRRSNRTPGDASLAWLYGRIEGGNELLPRVLRRAADELGAAGIQAVNPCQAPDFRTGNFWSSWSERHVGFIAGLGTFGLSASFITRLGSAGRLGSLVIDAAWPATPRPYTGIYEHCSRCGACIRRCPADAIAPEGKDHVPCAGWVGESAKKYAPRYGCGKCQTGVPCEAGIPPVRS